jgi:hypothetical protein
LHSYEKGEKPQQDAGPRRVPALTSDDPVEPTSQSGPGHQPGKEEGSQAICLSQEEGAQPGWFWQTRGEEEIAKDKTLTHDELDQHNRQDYPSKSHPGRDTPPGEEARPPITHLAPDLGSERVG